MLAAVLVRVQRCGATTMDATINKEWMESASLTRPIRLCHGPHRTLSLMRGRRDQATEGLRRRSSDWLTAGDLDARSAPPRGPVAQRRARVGLVADTRAWGRTARCCRGGRRWRPTAAGSAGTQDREAAADCRSACGAARPALLPTPLCSSFEDVRRSLLRGERREALVGC